MDTAAKVPHRSEIPVEFTWDLTTMYPDDASWQQAIVQLEALMPEVAALQGRVGENSRSLLRALQLRDQVNQQLEKIHAYANQRRDSDSGDPAAQAIAQRSGAVVARVQAALAFIEPEILGLSDETIRAWVEREPGLARYRFALEETARQRPHVRSAEVENVAALYTDVTRGPGEIFGMLTDVDLSFPAIQDDKGQAITLSHGRFRKYMESPDRRVRRDTFHAYYGAFQNVRNTLGTALAAAVRSHVVNARIHNYATTLEAALKPNNIPVAVYTNLLSTVEANLPRHHRYLATRKRLMGLDEMHLYDLYAPLIPEVEFRVPFTEAHQTIRDALARLGPAYGDALEQAFTRRWIDVYENVGKRSGAYSGGAYSTSPYILLNYQDRLEDMYTLTHELGHSMHSYFTRQTQPFVYGSYTAFLAEVASTVNEALLTAHLLETRPGARLRKRLIVQQLEDIRTTIIRQTMFARFELDIHQAAEAGEPLTTENLSQRYYDLVARYMGPDVVLAKDIALEWARIPHFYYNYYVFQYATGLSAAIALSKHILSEGQPAVDRYLKFLSSGSSAPSIELLRQAGVDMATPGPVQQAMETIDQLLDELESLH